MNPTDAAKLLAYASATGTGRLDAWRSDDDGLTWAIYSRTTRIAVIAPPVDRLNKNSRAIEIKLGNDAHAPAPDPIKTGPLSFQLLDIYVNVFSPEVSDRFAGKLAHLPYRQIVLLEKFFCVP